LADDTAARIGCREVIADSRHMANSDAAVCHCEKNFARFTHDVPPLMSVSVIFAAKA
jgi:hypothetical protein